MFSFEKKNPSRENHTATSSELAHDFLGLLESKSQSGYVFEKLEESLLSENFRLADTIDLTPIFYDSSLICRSESFTKTLDLLQEEKPIVVLNEEGQANMCAMLSGDGFKIAMTEGFSGKEVGDVVKTVITFRGAHLVSRSPIETDNELWERKPKTAEVSLVGKGEITLDDIEMVSFRFPIHMFPDEKLTETEREQLDDAGIKFIVRHYIPDHKKATH